MTSLLTDIVETVLDVSKNIDNVFNFDAKAKIITCNNKIFFPEQDEKLIHTRKFDPNGVGITFNAGSTRALTSSIGFILGLKDISIGNSDAFLSSQYISTASGGSWCVGTYYFAKQANNLTDEEILGKPIPLKLINQETLNSYNYDKKTFLPQRYYDSSNYLKFAESLVTSSLDEVWTNSVSKIFLEPYNIQNKIIALNDYYANEIKKNNPDITEVLIPPPDFPHWICNGCILYGPIRKQGLINIEMTPHYTGLCQVLGKGLEKIGGSLIETFAYGCKIPSIEELNKSDLLKNIQIPKSQGYFELKDLLGISSLAFGYGVKNIAESNILLGFVDNFNPTFDTWCSETPFLSKKAEYMDGYISGNGSGILALASRNIKKIISFLTPGSDIPLDIAQLANFSVLGSIVSPLYGRYNFPDLYSDNPNSVKIFESDKFDDFLQQVLNRKNLGGPIYVRQTLKVLPNLIHGIEGNYEVEILFVILQLNTDFNSELPTEITDQFIDPKSRLYQFPCYPEADFQYEFINYSKEQANLLISYTYWMLQNTELKDIIKSFYE
jgi:hypothetical protein